MQAVNSLSHGFIELVNIPLNKIKVAWVMIHKVAFRALEALSDVIIAMGFWERKEVKVISSQPSSEEVTKTEINLESDPFEKHINQIMDDFKEKIRLTLDAIRGAYEKEEISLDEADKRLIKLYQEPEIGSIISRSTDLTLIFDKIDTDLAERDFQEGIKLLNNLKALKEEKNDIEGKKDLIEGKKDLIDFINSSFLSDEKFDILFKEFQNIFPDEAESYKTVQNSPELSNSSEEDSPSPSKLSPVCSPTKRGRGPGTPFTRSTISYSQRVSGGHGSSIRNELPTNRALFS